MFATSNAWRIRSRPARTGFLQRRIGTTTIHVTHDQLEARDLIFVMRDGLIEQFGAPEELCRRPATSFVANFLGNPPMSVLRARLEREAGVLSLVVGATRLCSGESLTGLLDGYDDQTVEIACQHTTSP